MAMKEISVRMSEEEIERLQQIAVNNGRTFSNLIRYILSMYPDNTKAE